MTSVKISEMTRARADAERTVADDHSAKRGLTICFESLFPGEAKIAFVGADATGVGVLQNCNGRAAELKNQLGRCSNVNDIRVAESLSLELFEVVREIPVESRFPGVDSLRSEVPARAEG